MRCVVSFTPAGPARTVRINSVQQYACRWLGHAERPLRPALDSWNTLICSIEEQRRGAVAQGKPSETIRCRGAAVRAVAGLALAGAAAHGAAATPGCETAGAVSLLPVAANIWRVPAARGESDAGNAGVVTQLVVVRDGARVWLIGSGPTPAFGEALACAVRGRFGGDVTDVVNTRAAPELSMANVAFASARRWALPDVIAVMRARCTACLDRLKGRIGAAGETLAVDRIRVPSQPVGRPGAARGRLGPFAWLALARAPGERTLVLRHVGTRLVIAQGLVWAGDVPNLRDTHSATMLAGLRSLQRFAAGATLLGEQGEPAGPQAVASHIDYIAALRRDALAHLTSGDVDGASGSGVDLPAFAALPGYALVHPLNVQRVWREREPEIFR